MQYMVLFAFQLKKGNIYEHNIITDVFFRETKLCESFEKKGRLYVLFNRLKGNFHKINRN